MDGRIGRDGSGSGFAYARLGALLGAGALWLCAGRGEAQIAEYYHLDAGGSVHAVTDAQGQLVERHDYLPFGEEWCGTVVCNAVPLGQPRRFAGKEQDAESALHYFGARYLRAGVARFHSIDPASGRDQARSSPQRWNRYAYALNNPLKYEDVDGRWPSKILTYHQGAVDEALPNVREHDRQVLKWQQDYADEPANQVTAASFKHAMSGNDAEHRQTPQEARRLANDYIRAELEQARFMESLGVHSAALQHVGNVIHLLQDATSPAHAGFQPWDGTRPWWHPKVAWHVLKEGRVRSDEDAALSEATRRGWEYFTGAREMPSDFFGREP